MVSSSVRDVFGCDIGNGYGFISVLKDGKNDPISMFPPKYKLDSEGMPTAAYVTPPSGRIIEVFKGRPASDLHKKEPDKMVRAIKRYMRKDSHTISIPGINELIEVDNIYASIVRDLIILGNEERENRGEKPVYEIVFTYPASFEDDIDLLNRMQHSIENLVIDGHTIKVIGRLPEPAAVAIDYLFYLQNVAPAEKRIKTDIFTTLVYDLGHGTFDVAIVTARSKGKPFQLHYNDGLDDVGGIDFDQILYDELCRLLKSKCGYIPQNKNEREYIRDCAVILKHDLSDPSCRSVSKDFSLRDGDVETIEIDRTRFEKLAAPRINRTLEIVDKAINKANELGIHIDAIVLSGGASQMPLVMDGIKKFGIPIQMWRPSEAVSFGASRYARSIANVMESNAIIPKPIQESNNEVLEKFSEYSYGVWTESNKDELYGIVKRMIKSRTKLPATSDVVSFRSNSSRLSVHLYRTKNKYIDDDNLDPNKQCDSIMLRTFDVPSNSICEVKIEVMEDSNIRVFCRLNDGTILEQSTKDSYIK